MHAGAFLGRGDEHLFRAVRGVRVTLVVDELGQNVDRVLAHLRGGRGSSVVSNHCFEVLRLFVFALKGGLVVVARNERTRVLLVLLVFSHRLRCAV